ncbi:MAG: FAD-containing oxidoreductase [Pirellulaceae bacterium]
MNETQSDYQQRWLRNVAPVDHINPKPSKPYQLVVVGAGTAGLVAAAGAAGMGARVALIESKMMGGDCLNTGCVPSKSWIEMANQFQEARETLAEHQNPLSDSLRFDFSMASRRMQAARANISANDSVRRFQELGVDVYLGKAQFTGPKSIEVAGCQLTFARAIIATGARAAIPKIPGIENVKYLTNETLFDLEKIPESILIVGGGPIGCEMAQTLRRMGSTVTVADLADRILSRELPDASSVVDATLRREGITLEFGASITQILQNGDNEIVATIQSNQTTKQIVVNSVLLATGRTPNVEHLGLDQAGVAFDLKHGIHIDDYLRTSNPRVFAAGDCCLPLQFTHAADFSARSAIENALFFRRASWRKLLIPRCTYTQPNVAHVGMDWTEIEQRDDLQAYQIDYSDNDRAVLAGNEGGFIRVYCPKGKDRIVACTIVSELAGEMIGEVAMAIKHKIGLKQIASVIHPYPTRSDAFRRLGDQYNRTRLTPWTKKILARYLRFRLG